jgi:hypothetical protein
MNTSQGQGSTKADEPSMMMGPQKKKARLPFGCFSGSSTLNISQEYFDADLNSSASLHGRKKPKHELTTQENIDSY